MLHKQALACNLVTIDHYVGSFDISHNKVSVTRDACMYMYAYVYIRACIYCLNVGWLGHGMGGPMK